MWEVNEKWRDSKKENLMFRLKNTEIGDEKVCGVTQIAINDYYKTEDTLEEAEKNFEEHKDDIVKIAVRLISASETDGEGPYIITSGDFCKSPR